MRKQSNNLMIVDMSYPVFSEFLNHDDWRIIFENENNKSSAVFIPRGKKDIWRIWPWGA